MKIKYIFLSSVFLIFTLSYAYVENTHQDLFLKANLLYKSGKFEKSKDLYEKIPNKGSRVYYNLGNCFYRLDKYGYALLNWRRAEKQWGIYNKSELLENIYLLKSKLFGQKEQTTKIKFFLNIKNQIVSFIKSAPLLLIQIIFFVLWLFLFLYLRYLYKKRQKLLITTLFFLIALTGIVLAMKYTFEARRYGVVVCKQAKLLSGPSNKFQIIGVLPEAREALIKKDSANYYKIKGKGQVGWVSCKDMEEI